MNFSNLSTSHGMFSQPTVIDKHGQDHQGDGEDERRLVRLGVVVVVGPGAMGTDVAGQTVGVVGPSVRVVATAGHRHRRGVAAACRQLGDLGVDVLADGLVAELTDVGLVLRRPGTRRRR